MTKRILAAILAAGAVVATPGPIAAVANDQCGGASWYALAGNRTANGEIMNPDAMTAAHRSLPFGTRVVVTNQNNGRSVTLTINDRGPFHGGRIIDVSRAAAEHLGFRNAGTARVCLNRV